MKSAPHDRPARRIARSLHRRKDDDGGKTNSYPSQIPSSEKIPVVAWHGVRSSHASVERFQEAEQMGITLNYSRMGNVETPSNASTSPPRPISNSSSNATNSTRRASVSTP